jgi:hypothetical protein
MYLVIDSYGTRRPCWSWRTAVSWLGAASPDAAIVNRWTGYVLASRQQRRAY